jgi:pyruvate formate-lyase activating enzyme-like uncharacterized protein
MIGSKMTKKADKADNTLDPDDRRVLYRIIEQEYLEALRAQGIVFANRNDSEGKEAVINRLAKRGAIVRNKGASIHLNRLSSACIACTGDVGSNTFVLSLKCNRQCYFCFNPNQVDYQEHSQQLADWRGELDELGERPYPVTHIGLTGGEPLIHQAEALDFFKTVNERYPDIHTRLYTAGDLLDEKTLAHLRDAGLTEIRFSIKLDDPPELRDKVLDILASSRSYIPQVMVEMPVFPNTKAEMEELLIKLDGLGIFGINLLEFCFPRCNWEEFARRGFMLKNPPFPVLYDYQYAGGLPIAGSEELALELLEFALVKGLTLGIHYCSLENKHRDQIYQANMPYADALPYHELDSGDFFFKSIVVFDEDVTKLRVAATQCDVPFEEDPSDHSLQFKPSYLALLDGNDARFYCSYNIIELHAGEATLRELKLEALEC